MSIVSEFVRRKIRRAAAAVESAGDSVGPNDKRLANQLWGHAAQIREDLNRALHPDCTCNERPGGHCVVHGSPP